MMSTEDVEKNDAEQHFNKDPPTMAVPAERSSLRSVLIVATCTMAMIVNVGQWTPFSFNGLHTCIDVQL